MGSGFIQTLVNLLYKYPFYLNLYACLCFTTMIKISIFRPIILKSFSLWFKAFLSQMYHLSKLVKAKCFWAKLKLPAIVLDGTYIFAESQGYYEKIIPTQVGFTSFETSF